MFTGLSGANAFFNVFREAEGSYNQGGYNNAPQIPYLVVRGYFAAGKERGKARKQGCSLGLERLGLEAVSRRFLESVRLVSVL